MLASKKTETARFHQSMLLGSSLAGTHNWVSSVDNEKACLFRQSKANRKAPPSGGAQSMEGT
jgi:hypothetical protein